ncbi:MAG TPA: hypothetical protein VFI12_10245 [Thermomicrobiales bacterium]|nr:hypothetical protein [Thermomicrobiales bacterium]
MLRWSINNEAFIKAVQAISFPAEFVGDQHALVRANTNLDALIRNAYGGATSLSNLGYYWNPKLDKAELSAVQASALVRADLGLPPVPTHL